VTAADGGGVLVTVDRDACQGHGECARIAPAVFVLDDTLTARCDEVQPLSRLADLEHAESSCPAQAIRVLTRQD
jgi:ferredoxin